MTNITAIAHIRSDFPTKFGIPRQSGLVPGLRATVVFEEEYRNRDALRGLEKFSHLWLLWGFSAMGGAAWSPTVRPPRLGGNTRVGVFATRSPNRPNSIGLSSVRLESIELSASDGPLIHVLGADLMDGTPIYDIKPYLPSIDEHPDATDGFTDQLESRQMDVRFDSAVANSLTAQETEVISGLLALDPRPSYHDDPNRVYGMEYGGYDVRFTVQGSVLTVTELQAADGSKIGAHESED